MDRIDTAEVFDSFVGQRRQFFRGVKSALERRLENRVAVRGKKEKIGKASSGVLARSGNLVLVKEAESALHRKEGRGDK